MKNRLRQMLGDKNAAYVCTYHSFCVKVLREDIFKIEYPKNFKILDTEDQKLILRDIYKENGFRLHDCTHSQALDYISGKKCEGEYINKYLLTKDNKDLKTIYEEETNIKAKIFYGYLLEQKRNFALDFDDLIEVVLYIFQIYEEVLTKWQKRMMYIMVDEFQDVSDRQYLLTDLLSDYHKNLFVVGDPNQTIYTWRGAKIDYILNFDKAYTNCKTIKLNQNYRSTPEILDVANSLIKANKDSIQNDLIANKPNNVIVVYNHAKTMQQEAEWIVKNILNIINAGMNYGDIAVLYRSHFVSRNIEQEFIKNRIPYKILSGVEFYKRKEIKDLLSDMRIVVNTNDDIAFERVINEPRRGVGIKRLAYLKDYAKRNNCSLFNSLVHNIDNILFKGTQANEFIEFVEKYNKTYIKMKISELFENILNDTKYREMIQEQGEDERLENIKELEESIFDYEKKSGDIISIDEYLQYIALYTNSDTKEKKNSIKLMTIHTAKGLEFQYVFVCALSEGILPNSHAHAKKEIEEERRLSYVAFTRAQNALFLSDSEGYNFDNTFRSPSRFIFNIDKNVLKYETEIDVNLVKMTQEVEKMEFDEAISADIFDVNDRVFHKVFGNGTIIKVDLENQEYTIKFDNISTMRTLSSDAGMKKL